jgi:putative ubiquitin-RnfH superfamily antitoxin RatB of RatAB toxin-antitoxin module
MNDSIVRVTVAWSPAARKVIERAVELPLGATAAQALAAVGQAEPADDALSIWGRKAGLTQVLADGDRVELCRPLRVDPKVARRERFNQQGSRRAGLFSNRRPGAKPGY